MALLFLTACYSEEPAPAAPAASAEVLRAVDYGSPIDFPILLAGNFGEPRPGHYHGGIDVKTQGVVGKPIYSVAEGYVSRLTVNLYGFGNAIYVAHPDGRTSVYCHLQRFADEYEGLFTRYPGDTLSIDLPAGDFPVNRGQLIAYGGNTGHSFGPHLHLEIHNTRNWALLDPLDFVGSCIADTVPPVAHAVMAIPVKGCGVFCSDTARRVFSLGSEIIHNRQIISPNRRFTAWGRVAFALSADDYAQNTYNHYGVRLTRLLVDGREVFRADVDSIPRAEQRAVGQSYDVNHWRRSKSWFMHTGEVTFSEERPYALTFVLQDYYGNRTSYALTVDGVPARIPILRKLPFLLSSTE